MAELMSAMNAAETTYAMPRSLSGSHETLTDEVGSQAVASDRILVVDDHPDTRSLIGTWLRHAGLEHLEAEDADSALRMLESQPIGVVVCDRWMPGRDGLWLLERIRENYPAIAILLATADDSILPRFTMQSGVLGYLLKPLDEKLLIDSVRDALVWHHVAARRRA